MEEITGQVFITMNAIRVNDDGTASPDDFIALEVFPNLEEANHAVALMHKHELEPSIGRMDRIAFEEQLPGTLAAAPLRVFVIRWDLPGYPGEAEMSDHMDHLNVEHRLPTGAAFV